MRNFPELKTFLVDEDDPQNAIDNEGIRDALHQIERAWTDHLTSRIRNSRVREIYPSLREQAFLFGRPDFIGVRALAGRIMKTLAHLRRAIADALGNSRGAFREDPR